MRYLSVRMGRNLGNFFVGTVAVLAAWLWAGQAVASAAVQIDVRAHDEAGWQVDYQWDEPVQALRFLLPAWGLRQRWTIATPGLWLEPMGRTARLVHVDGKSFAGASIQFATDTTPLNNAYEFFAQFSDGGLMLYTGYLVARPMREADNRSSGLPGTLAFTLHARKDERVVSTAAAVPMLTLAKPSPRSVTTRWALLTPERQIGCAKPWPRCCPPPWPGTAKTSAQPRRNARPCC